MKQDYKTYEIIDFIEDQSFIEFVHKSDSKSLAFWTKWIADNPTSKQKTDEAIATINQIRIQDVPSLSDQGVDDLFARINTSIENPVVKDKPGKIKQLNWIRYAAAAAILLLIGFWVLKPSFSTESQFKTKFAEQKMVELPDRSTVNLNVDSELKFDKKSWTENRSVSLDGEAFFSVEKGESFVVNSSIGSVEVLGTSFNVLNRDGYFEVICLSGKVKVSINDQVMEEIITPNESIYYNQRTKVFEKRLVAKAARKLWMDGSIYFVEKPMEYVFSELERKFDVTIIDKKQDGLFQGKISMNSLDSAIYDVCWPMNLNYEINGKTITIKK